MWVPRCPFCDHGTVVLVPKDHRPVHGELNQVGCTQCGKQFHQTFVVWVRL
jgi:transcription elongation factor Elf1